MAPRVSVCLPNLNNRQFLDERLESIFSQSYSNWELVVCDSYSDDGAWELFQSHARNDSRIRLFQAPRDGIYPNWNRCIEAARGELVYIATSDDTFASDCLEKMVSALDDHAQCGMAHCPLRIFDDASGTERRWWSDVSLFALSSGKLIDQPHIRRAPFDGLLHLVGKSVFISVTQVLIRRSLFDEIGLFPTKFGPPGDFNWQMRAGLAADVIHVPDTWGGWRVHQGQATADDASGIARDPQLVEEMIADALAHVSANMPEDLRKMLEQKWFGRMRAMRRFIRGLSEKGNLSGRRGFLAQELLRASWPAWLYARLKLTGGQSVERSIPCLFRESCEEALRKKVLEPISASAV